MVGRKKLIPPLPEACHSRRHLQDSWLFYFASLPYLWSTKETGIQAPIRWLFWGASLPSSQSAGSPIKVFSLPQVTYSGLAGSYLNIWAPTLGKGKIPGTFWLKVQFPNTHTKEVKSQGLLLTNPRKGGRRSSDLGEGELSTPGHKHGGRK